MVRKINWRWEMWDYINKTRRYLAETIKEYKAGIVIAACSITASFLAASCTPGEWNDFWAEQRQLWDDVARENEMDKYSVIKTPDGNTVIIVNDHHRDRDWDSSGLRRATRDLERLNRQQRLEGARIRAHTQKMLYQMQLEKQRQKPR